MPTQHPSEFLLSAFVLGKLSEAESADLEDHLDHCTPCQARSETLAPAVDTFTSLLANAAGQTNQALAQRETPAVVPVQATAAWGDPPALAPTLTLDVPPGLAQHPRYRLVRKLGAGGMGVVWLAQHTVMNRPVAVKAIRPELLAHPKAAERFLREVRAAARLQHPNIVTAYDAEQVDGAYLLAMEFVPGDGLADLLQAGPLSIEAACQVAHDTACGLAHAHAAGLVHRDIKPNNLIRTPAGATKILDFGLATAEPGASNLTGANMVIGTPDYIAPEQARDAHSADFRADLYALGCTLYHLLTGQVPFPTGTVLAKLDAHRFQPVPDVRQLRPAVPTALAALVARLTAKVPAERGESASAVAAELTPFIRPQVVAPVRERTRWGWVAGLAAVAALVLAGVVIIRDRHGNEVARVIVPAGGTVEVKDAEIKPAPTKPTNEAARIIVPAGGTVEVKGAEIKPAPAKPSAAPTEVLQLLGHTEKLNAIAYSPDGTRLVTAGRDRVVLVWDTTTGKLVQQCLGHTGQVYEARFTPDGQTIVSGGDDAFVRIWDVASGKQVAALQTPQWIVSLAISSDGTRVALGGFGNYAAVWNLKTGLEVCRFMGHQSSVHAVAFTPDGQQVISTGGPFSYEPPGDTSVQVWNAQTGQAVAKGIGHTKLVRRLAVFPDGQRVASASFDGTVRVWELATGKEVLRLVTTAVGTHGLALAADGKRLFTADLDGTARVFAVDAGREVQRFVPLEGSKLGYVAQSPDGRRLAFVGESRVGKVWQMPGE
jgi:WD40 repeat protein